MYKAVSFGLLLKVISNGWFQKCKVKTNKTDISDILILTLKYGLISIIHQNMFIDSIFTMFSSIF